MKHLYFVRHGETELNKKSLIAGSTETPLTSKGRKQARHAGEAAKDLYIDYIVCSPLSRARETAKIIAKEIGYPINKIHVNDLFIERDFGEAEGQPWLPDLNLDGFADVESVDSLLNRARLALKFLKNLNADNVLVVSHGSLGRALRHLIDPSNPIPDRTSTPETKLSNAKIVQWL